MALKVKTEAGDGEWMKSWIVATHTHTQATITTVAKPELKELLFGGGGGCF